MHPRSLRIGLTGGIASGKSAAARAFAALGVPVIDADQVAREVVAPGEACLQAVKEEFGSGVLADDGSLDRRALREIVFADPARRRRLEAILHPEIGRRIRAWLEAQDAPYVILESPLLLETSQHRLVDRVLVIDVSEALQLTRTMTRDQCDEARARAILAAQMPRALRLQRAQDIIVNDSGLEELGRQVTDLHQRYQALAREPR